MPYAPRKRPIVRRFRTKQTSRGRFIRRTVVEKRATGREMGRPERKMRAKRKNIR